MSIRASTCQTLGEVSRSLLFWKKNFPKDICGPVGYWQEFKRQPDQVTCGQKYYSVQNQFERFRGFLELIRRFEFELRRRENYIFWRIRIFGAFMWMCRGLFVPTQFHFECCGFRDSWWQKYTFQWNHCGRSCKSFVKLGFGWRKTNRTLIVKVVHNKRG